MVQMMLETLLMMRLSTLQGSPFVSSKALCKELISSCILSSSDFLPSPKSLMVTRLNFLFSFQRSGLCIMPASGMIRIECYKGDRISSFHPSTQSTHMCTLWSGCVNLNDLILHCKYSIIIIIYFISLSDKSFMAYV